MKKKEGEKNSGTKVRITETLDVEEARARLEQPESGDPIAQSIKDFILNETPFAELEEGSYEFRIKVHKRIGETTKRAKCANFSSESLENVCAELWEGFGNGEYYLFINYRKVNNEKPEKWRFTTIKDVPVYGGDAEEELGSEEPPVDLSRQLPLPFRPAQNNDMMGFLTSMLLAQQQTSEKLMLSLVENRGNPGSSGGDQSTVLDAFTRGIELAQDLGATRGSDDGMAGDGGDPDSIPSKIKQYLPLIGMAKDFLKPSAPLAAEQPAAPAPTSDAHIKKLKEILADPESAATLKKLQESPETAEMIRLLMK